MGREYRDASGGQMYRADGSILDVAAWLDDLLDIISAGTIGVEVKPGEEHIGEVDVAPLDGILEGGLTELVGVDDTVNTSDYGASVAVALPGTYSGEITSFMFYATKSGTGAIQDSAGILYVLKVDPEIVAGATAMTAAAWVTQIGKVIVTAADWHGDANGGCAFIYEQPVPFHSLGTLYFVWFHTDATDLNDGAGDDEQLEFNFWYRRDS